MSAHDLARSWLTSGDTAKVAHALYRLTQPDTPVEPIGPFHRLALRCPFRSRPIEGCGCHRCHATGQRVDVVACVLCVRGRVRALGYSPRSPKT